MRFSTSPSLRNEQGATAIEYALIAALIGIGLIGSLVTTRGSISGIFGTAATQMASAPSGTAAPAGSGWASKTMARPATHAVDENGTATASYLYTDGTQVTYTMTPWDPTSTYAIQITDPANRQVTYVNKDQDGNVTSFERDTYSDDMTTVLRAEFATQFSGTPSRPVDQVTTIYGSDGQPTQTVGTPSASFLSLFQGGVGDLAYFEASQS
jgi:pilus assembly protein Flp/PilA